MTEPLGYLAFLNLMANARLAMTDLEAQRLPAPSRRRRRSWVCPFDKAQGRPCLTLRENTERPVTVT